MCSFKCLFDFYSYINSFKKTLLRFCDNLFISNYYFYLYIGHVPSLQVDFLWRKIKIFCIFTFDFSEGIYSLVNVNAVLCSLKGECMNFFLPLCESIIFF